MADNTSTIPSPKPPAPFVFNKEACEDKLKKVKDNLATYNGKPGYNPFFYFNSAVKPLETSLNEGITTEALQNAIMSLDEKCVPNATGETAKQNRDSGCDEPQAAGKSHALGQIVRPGQ